MEDNVNNTENNHHPSTCDSDVEHAHNKTVSSVNSQNHSHSTNEGFCYYLGLLMLAPFLKKIQNFNEPILSQWLSGILLGCKNIEQTKTLNFSSLNILLGNVTKSKRLQRDKLRSLEQNVFFEKLITFNTELVKSKTNNDFYYDPHTKHYTGIRNILKGWCSKVRMADKVLNMDFIHNTAGYPVYFNVVDNYDDLRIRFFNEIRRFRKLANVKANEIYTFVVDRGIFSEEVFNSVLLTNNIHLITWEKGYKKDKWNDSAAFNSGIINRLRNSKEDYKEPVIFDYQELKWSKNISVRQLIVRIKHPSNALKIEVSILTDDFSRSACVIICLMFNRWIQENDFKYLIEHFGIDQITSYQYDNYQSIKDVLDDKEYISGVYKSLTKTIGSIRGKLKTVLLKKHRLIKKYGYDIVKRPSKINKRETEFSGYITSLYQKLEESENDRSGIKKNVSKLDELIKNNTQRLDTNCKKLMDAIRIIARNIFYLNFEEFKSEYNDFRDDLLIFRNIIRANGIIKIREKYLEINLIPEMELTPKMKRVLNKIISRLNQENLKMPDGSDRKIQIKCGNKKEPLFVFGN